MSEHVRSAKSRGYRKTKRAENVEATRARIVDAAVGLHGTIGPANTTVAAIAASANVTRATVYRHFPDDETMFIACSSAWRSRQRLPDLEAWSAIPDAESRLRQGLLDLYRYFSGGSDMLALIARDAQSIPASVASQSAATRATWVAALLAPFPRRRRRVLRAAVAHAAAFPTWRSLCVDAGLTNAEAADLMVAMVLAAAG